MVRKNKSLHFFITTTLVFLGVAIHFWNENRKLKEFQEDLPSSIANMLYVVSNQTCKDTVSFVCSTQADCRYIDVEALKQYCDER